MTERKRIQGTNKFSYTNIKIEKHIKWNYTNGAIAQLAYGANANGNVLPVY